MSIFACVWVGVDSVWEQEKLEARKMLENAAESHTSGAPCRIWASCFTKETRAQWEYTANRQTKSRTKQWRRVHSLSRGAPWFPIKMMYSLVALVIEFTKT